MFDDSSTPISTSMPYVFPFPPFPVFPPLPPKEQLKVNKKLEVYARKAYLNMVCQMDLCNTLYGLNPPPPARPTSPTDSAKTFLTPPANWKRKVILINPSEEPVAKRRRRARKLPQPKKPTQEKRRGTFMIDGLGNQDWV
jgi:hypothetical protein